MTSRRRSPLGLLAAVVSLAALCASQAALAQARMPLRLKAGTFDPVLDRVPTASHLQRSPDDFYLVQFRGPVQERWKQALARMGARVGHYVPECAFVVKMSPPAASRVSRLPFVRWLGPLWPGLRMSPEVTASSGPVDILVRTFPGESIQPVLRTLRMTGATVVRAGKNRVVARVPGRDAAALGALPGVQWVERLRPVRLFNAVSRQIIAVEPVWQSLGFYGAGQVIAVCDTGLDTGDLGTLHADFQSRVLAAHALGRPGDWSDWHGHGTHVMATAVGSGVLSGSNPGSRQFAGSFAGVAPEALLVVQSVMDETLGLGGIPDDLTVLFQQAYDDGARIHSNSWGAEAAGEYTSQSEDVDAFVHSHPDAVIVFSAGNSGVDLDLDGVVDFASMASPATAKNCIAVGAGEGLQYYGGLAHATWGNAFGLSFQAPPISGDYVSDNAEGMAAISSRGPCADGRIKPDICAPGTNIISARSHHPYATTLWGEYDANYVYSGGTSTSAPMVAGAAALVRQYYEEVHGHEPSAALVKATLLNRARDTSPGQYGIGAWREIPGRPNHVQGWGRLDVREALAPSAPERIAWVEGFPGVSTGTIHAYYYDVTYGGAPLKITLVWTDPEASPMAAKALVNDLTLHVLAPGGQEYLGNGGDNVNNVEEVDFACAAAGSYAIIVEGANVPAGPQPYALVVSGGLAIQGISGRISDADGNGLGEVTVTITGGSSYSTTTSLEGIYRQALAAGDYTVTPSRPGWTFTPASIPVSVGLGAEIVGVDFVGTPSGQASISGNVFRYPVQPLAPPLESPHPYADNSATMWTVGPIPGATKIRVHFRRLDMAGPGDYVRVQSPATGSVDMITGSRQDVWSSWFDDNQLRIWLHSDSAVVSFGFIADLLQTQPADPVPDVTVELSNGATTQTGPDGTYAFTDLDPGSLVVPLSAGTAGRYTVTPTRSHWAFWPESRVVDVGPEGHVSGVNFEGRPPGSIAGKAVWGFLQGLQPVVESQHPYPDDTTGVWTVGPVTGATKLRLHLATVGLAAGDYIDITDSAGAVWQRITGSSLDTWTRWIPGDTIGIRLVADLDDSDFGFLADRVQAATNQGVEGATLTLDTGEMVTSRADGTFDFAQVKPGTRRLSAVKPPLEALPAEQPVGVPPSFSTTGIEVLFYSADLATTVSHNLGTAMYWGQSLQVEITFRNDGTTTWTRQGGYELRSVGDDVWGVSAVSLGESEAIAPGQTKTFSFTITAPSTTGQHVCAWQMHREGVGLFPARVECIIGVTRFQDVPYDDWGRAYIEAMANAGITLGCAVNPPRFCPDDNVTRAQMAVFLCRAAGKAPLDREVPTFTDVPKTYWAYAYIERLADPASWACAPPTAGCSLSPPMYCPGDDTLRMQMAAFLCRANCKSVLNNPAATFADVPVTHPFYGWIERLADPASWACGAPTTGCQAVPVRKFCPNDKVTRRQMAVFIVRAFCVPF